ncbi:MAG TPA: hypothetical protein VLE19_04835 [Pyrinomonadaceae bacterium]|nr:hypothetical protein [Pyrinomonadaceae bacterium]
MKRMLTAAMLMAVTVGSSFAIPVFGQDQSGQMMQTENKMGDTMMKSKDDKMMKHGKKSNRKNKKKMSKKKSADSKA